MTFQTAWTRRGVLTAGGAGLLAGAATTATAADLRGDVAILREAYGALHPGLHRYASPSRVEAGYQRLAAALTDARDVGEQFLALNRFTAAVKCGHTQPNPFNQSDAIEAAILRPRRLPFAFQWLAGEMVVTWSDAATALPRGARILGIDGRGAADILRQLLPLARADGSNAGKRIAQMGVSGQDRYETFDIAYALLFGSPGDGVLIKAVLPGETAPRRIEVASLPGGEPRLPTPDSRSDAPLWTLDRLPDGVLKLTMPTWALFNSKWDWQAFLADALDEAAGARTLIVDVRGNEGGLDCGDAILRRLVRQDTRPLAYRRLTRYRRTPAHLNPHLDTWDRSFRDWGEEAVGPDAEGYYALRDEPDDPRAVIRPDGKPVRGRVHVLTDAICSSATFQFAQVIKDTGIATLAGTTTGGNRRGINGGAFFFLGLPASGLEVDLPLIGRFPVTPQPDAGIEPDLPVSTTAADIAAGHDPVLERVLSGAA
jgi:hypothetical protein